MPYHRSSSNPNDYSPDVGGGEEGPTYLIEHLATFEVSKETRIVYPADGMRKLLQLEKSNGIWSQKMNLRLDKNWVLIMDYETGAIVERFPVTAIQEPTAFTSTDPIEIYNNTLVFIVVDDRQPNVRSEMHIFQCQMISAQDLVEDLKMLRLGKNPTQRGRRVIPPPPHTLPPQPPTNGALRDFPSRSHGDGKSAEGGAADDETSSTSSEKYGRDVTTLNHCFDDIEKFIARLQHVAAASRELDHRRKTRKSKKKDAMGDGMLTMRAKPPPEVEFIDIFQKFKLSFILLAKLKHHIHDPNAPELVHFLFTPLALIVDASHDTNYGNLPAKVLAPLLTQEAVNLLINCVTSKETELWHSLGDVWLIPRDQWKGYVPPYHPVFMDGWSPDYSVIDDREERREIGLGTILKQSHPEEIHSELEHNVRESHFQREPESGHYNSSDYFDYEPSPRDQRYEPRSYTPRNQRYRDERELPVEGESPEPGSAAPRSDISADSIERNAAVTGSSEKFERAQARWLEQLRNTSAKIVQVKYPRTANNDKELSVSRGEFLQVLDDSRKWWKARNSRGEIAHVPHTIVTVMGAQSNPEAPTEGGDLSFHPFNNRANFHPQESGSINPRPSPSPPPPPPPINMAFCNIEPPRKAEVQSKGAPSFQDELRVAVSTGTLKKQSRPKLALTDLKFEDPIQRLPVIQIKKTPNVYISMESTPKEVQEWLKAKGFSESLCESLANVSGKTLLEASEQKLEQIRGHEEGKRLLGQLSIQKTVSGFKSKRETELAEKLASARSKAEKQ